VNELELIRSECLAFPAPDADAVAAAREALRREIGGHAVERPAARRRRRGHSPALGAIVALALVALLVLLLPSRRSPLGTRVAAAAAEALSPPDGRIVHSISRTIVTRRGAARTSTSEFTDEVWSTSGPGGASLDRNLSRSPSAGPITVLLTACGVITYESGANLFTVMPAVQPFDAPVNPVVAARNALRYGHVDYRGAARFHGIAASKLVVTQYGSVTTYVVRRDNGYPLETIDRRVTPNLVTTRVTTYSLFEHLAPTPRNAQLLGLTPHPGAFYVRTAAAARTAGCSQFGSLQSLTERSGSE